MRSVIISILLASAMFSMSACQQVPQPQRYIQSGWKTPDRSFIILPTPVLIEANLRIEEKIKKEGPKGFRCIVIPRVLGYEVLILSELEIGKEQMEHTKSLVEKSISEAWIAISEELKKE